MCFSCEVTDFQEGRGVKIVVGRPDSEGRKVLKTKVNILLKVPRAICFSPWVWAVKHLHEMLRVKTGHKKKKHELW